MKVHDGSASLIVDFDTLHLRCGTDMRPTFGLLLVLVMTYHGCHMQMLNDITDATPVEKWMMFRWNCFIRKQRYVTAIFVLLDVLVRFHVRAAMAESWMPLQICLQLEGCGSLETIFPKL
jgi:hypothetical protein